MSIVLALIVVILALGFMSLGHELRAIRRVIETMDARNEREM